MKSTSPCPPLIRARHLALRMLDVSPRQLRRWELERGGCFVPYLRDGRVVSYSRLQVMLILRVLRGELTDSQAAAAWNDARRDVEADVLSLGGSAA